MNTGILLERIDYFCSQKGISKTKAFIDSGVGKDFAYNLKRSAPSAEKIAALAAYFGTSTDYLLGTEPPLESNVDGMTSKNIFRVPLYESVSAGFGAYADSQIREYYEVYVESHFVAKNTIAIRVKGDSMYPKIEDGDVILVQREGEVKSGDIGVAMIGEEAFVKKIEFDKKGLRLISINPEYPPKIFEGKDAEQVKIVGRVYRIIKEC